jgi:hypothetical protein
MNDNQSQEQIGPLALSLTEFVRYVHHAATIARQLQNDLVQNPDRIERANEIGVIAANTLTPDGVPRSVIIAATASVLATVASQLVNYEITTGKAEHGSLECMIGGIALAAYQLVESNTQQAMQLNELVGERDAHN